MLDASTLLRRHRPAPVLALALVAGCHAPVQPLSRAPADAPALVAATAWLPAPAAREAEPAEPSISLTASDGTGLRLLELRAHAWVEAPLALTELHLTFENPDDRTIEGNFTIQLPPRAAISRFAMKIGDAWQEGEVVERQAARRVFEDFLHQRQDPALLEHDAGDRFQARVFPIPARGRKQLIVTYSQELAGSHADYRLPLAGLARLDTLDIRVLGPDPARPGEVRELHRTVDPAAATADLTLRESGPHDLALRSGDLALARFNVAGEAALTPVPKAISVLFDTSASQAARFPDKVARLAALVDRLAAAHGDLPVRVWCFDQEALEIYRGPARGFTRTHTAEILRRRALGASDLTHALHELRTGAHPGEQLILLGDGVATAGDTDGNALTDAVTALRKAGVTRIDAVLTGGNRDTAAMTRLATSGADAHAGIVVDGALTPAEIADKLRRPTFSDVHVTVPGSRWTWPDRLDGVQPGDTVLVYADLPAGHPLEVELDGGLIKSPKLTTRTVERPLLERAWVGARITRLLAMQTDLPTGDVDMRNTLRAQVVDLSRKHRVLSPFTGLLVLETEFDYQRYGIPRDALTDILAIGKSGPELLRRARGALHVTSIRDAGSPTLVDPTLAPRDVDTRPRRNDDVIDTNKTRTSRPDTGDLDGDGATDSDDRCPGVPETFNGYQDEDGCPDEIPTQLARFSGTIRGIYFDPRSARIRDRSRPVVDRALAVLRDFDTIRVEISGHTAPGEPEGLGLRRAAAVRDYLVRHGISPDRLDIRDAGDKEPVDTNRTSAGRARNRRIEYQILVDNTRTTWTTAPTWTPPPPPPAPTPAKSKPTTALTGKYAEILAAIPTSPKEAVILATAWHDQSPGDVLAALALGEALVAAGDRRTAARAFGSLIDLHPARADLRRHAGERLAPLGDPGLALAIDTYKKAVDQRPDHPTGRRLLAYALASAGRHADALTEILAAVDAGQARPRPGVDHVLHADAALLAAVAVAHAPARRTEILAELQRRNLPFTDSPSTSFILTWETDANDVDLHVRDAHGGHASYERRQLPSGGYLAADVTTGYGPEMFTILGKPRAYPYTLSAHYYGQGPMGYGMGTLQVVEHDGKGALHVDERPFVIMHAGATVPLGTVRAR